MITALRPKAIKSKISWEKILPSKSVSQLIESGGLTVVSDPNVLHGLEELLDTGNGPQEYNIFHLGGIYELTPVDGGSTITFDLADKIFEATPEKALQRFLVKSGFELQSPSSGQSELVHLWKRPFANKSFTVVTTLDDQLVQSDQFQLWLKDMTTNSHLIILGRDVRALAQCALNRGVQVGTLETDDISAYTLSWIASLVDVRYMVELFPEKKLIIHVPSSTVFFEKTLIKLKGQSKPLEYILGCTKLEGSMNEREFAKYLGIHDDDFKKKLTDARAELNRAIKKAYEGNPAGEAKAHAFLLSEKKKNLIESNLKAIDFVVIP